jgi:hypothetical protein
MPVSQQRRDELSRLAEKATPGPWRSLEQGGIVSVRCQSKTAVVHWMGFDDCDRPIAEHVCSAAFIAAAREALPALLADLSAVERERDEAHAILNAACQLNSDVPLKTLAEMGASAVMRCDELSLENDELREQLAVLKKGGGT